MENLIKNVSSPPCWPYVDLLGEIKIIRALMEERKGANADALALARGLMEKKLEEMNGIKKEVLEQSKAAAAGTGERKWIYLLMSALISAIAGGAMAYLISRGG